jgi:hypothetical protein
MNMPNRLKKLLITEVSLVDEPACEQARVVLFKRDDGGDSRDLVSKCLTSIAKEDFQAISKQDIEGALDLLARTRAERTGEKFHVAYSEILRTDDGGRLYSGLDQLRIQGLQRESASTYGDDAA